MSHRPMTHRRLSDKLAKMTLNVGFLWPCACVISYHVSISRLDPFFESVLIDKYRGDKNQASDKGYKLQA